MASDPVSISLSCLPYTGVLEPAGNMWAVYIPFKSLRLLEAIDGKAPVSRPFAVAMDATRMCSFTQRGTPPRVYSGWLTPRAKACLLLPGLTGLFGTATGRHP